MWAVVASNTPATNRFASKKEKLYIMKSLAVESSKQSLSVWLTDNVRRKKQEVQLSQRGRAMRRVTEYFVNSLEVTQGH